MLLPQLSNVAVTLKGKMHAKIDNGVLELTITILIVVLNSSLYCTFTLNSAVTIPAILVQVIPGRDGAGIETLCWVGQRLFSAGLRGEITEYDLENLQPKCSVDAYGGPIWTISCNSTGTLLAVSKHILGHFFSFACVFFFS